MATMRIYVSRETMAEWQGTDMSNLPYKYQTFRGLGFSDKGDEFYVDKYDPEDLPFIPKWIKCSIVRVTIRDEHPCERKIGFYSQGGATAYVHQNTYSYEYGQIEKSWKFSICAPTLESAIEMYHQLIEGSIQPRVDGTKQQDGWTTKQLRDFDDWANNIRWTIEALKNMPIFGSYFRKRLSRIPTS